MLLNFEDTFVNIVTNGTLYLYFIFIIILFFPLKSNIGNYKWTRYIPFISVGLYIIYESVIPARWNLRFDLLVIWSLLFIILIISLIRSFRYKTQKN